MSFTKITTEDLADKGVVGLPDTPNLSVTALQKKFDEIATDVIVPKFNGLVDELDEYESTVDISNRVKSTEITNIRTDEDDKIQVSRDNGTTWTSTASSGHIIEDGNGVSYPSRSRMQFSANVNIADQPGNNTTFIQIASGEKGETGKDATIKVGTVTSGTDASVTNVGSKSDAIFDFVLPKGDSGNAATIQVGTVVSGQNASVSNRGTSSNAILDFILPKGDKGDAGTSFQVLGMYETYSDLIAAHPVGNRGDAYSVGTSTSNVIYNWNNDTSMWDNLGSLQGAKGDTGDAATLTVGTVTTLEPTESAYATNDGTTSNAIFSFGIPKGAKGDTGNAATIAVGTVTKGTVASVTNVGTSTNAIFDMVLPKGDQGNPTTVNGKSGTSITLNGSDLLLSGYDSSITGDVTDSDTVNQAISKLANSTYGVSVTTLTNAQYQADKATYDASDNLINITDVGQFDARDIDMEDGTSVQEAIEGIDGEVSSVKNALSTFEGTVSDAYSSTKAYTKDSFCIHNNSLWKCLVACSGQIPTEGTYWTKTTISDSLTQIDRFVPKIDTSNVVQNKTYLSTYNAEVTLFTATEDCYMYYDVYGTSSTGGYITIDGIIFDYVLSNNSSNLRKIGTIFIPKGALVAARTSAMGAYKLYGVK